MFCRYCGQAGTGRWAERAGALGSAGRGDGQRHASFAAKCLRASNIILNLTKSLVQQI